MPDHALDVIGVGNAIVDVLAHADDAFLAAHAIAKGGMTLIDEAAAKLIYEAMAPAIEISGGSAANTVACVASLGGQGGFIGKVADDTLGEFFRHDLRATGVAFDTAPLEKGSATARSLINVTPDAQRSMSTYLGAATQLCADDVDEAQVRRAAITYFEGYLFEMPRAREAFIRACRIARAAGRKTAITLSDSGCVDRQHAAFVDFIGNHVDILLANEAEARTLFESSHLDVIAERARALCPFTAVTRSEKGSILIPRDGEVITVAARPPEKLVDTTGAGDAYAGGLLFGLSRDLGFERAGALASLAASEIISHIGARSETNLRALAEKTGLL
ncbi:MAG: adenosine kinase [Parvularculaceae bacterium]